jgi:acyl-CoA synthetase (AMP-forming)/AMP-acid ligase II
VTRDLNGFVAASLARHAGAPALTYAGRTVTFAELDGAVDRLSGELRAAAGGTELTGRRVAIVAPNVPALVTALLASWRLGAVAVPLNARLREHELSQILADAEPALVVSTEEHLGFRFTELLPRLLRELATVRACLFVEGGGGVVRTLVGPAAREAAPLDGEAAAILYTSGTTGEPKGAIVTQARELATAPELAAIAGLGSDDRVAFVVPASHAFGFTCLLAALDAGAETVLVDSTTTVGPLLDALAAPGTSIVHGSPGLFSTVLKARPEALRAVRGGFVAGAPSPPSLLDRLGEAGIVNLYGLTETGAVACCRRDDPPERRRTTVGRPLPGVEVRAHGGELEVRGVGLGPGYFRRDDETSAAFHDGWFRTRDLAELDDGYVRVHGREQEVVHIGGFNVFPAEVEAALLTHPGVLQAAVVGVEDERQGEVLRAFVVPRPGEELHTSALLRFARGQIAGYKLPYAIDVVSELPLLPSGKPDRTALARR